MQRGYRGLGSTLSCDRRILSQRRATVTPMHLVRPTVCRSRRWLGSVLVLVALLTTLAAAGCGTPALSVDRVVYSLGSSGQAIVVTSPGYGSSYATLETFSRVNGTWVRAFPAMSARVGWNGFAPPGLKREGDGRTPTGRFDIGPFMWGALADPGVRYPYRRLVYGDWWDEHVGSPTYNSWQYAPVPSPPFAAGSEALWTELPAYDYAATITYNTSAPVQGAGSGIFLHVGTGGSTAGCVSLASVDLPRVLRWLNPAVHPSVVLGTSSTVLR